MNKFKVSDNDKNKLLKYKERKDKKTLFKAAKGGNIVGEEVDQNNRLLYVIEKDSQLSLHYAEEIDVLPYTPEPKIESFKRTRMFT